MQVRRLKVFGLIGRCEAMSGGDSVLIEKGYLDLGKYQCERFATTMRDGHRVCTSHDFGRAKRVIFADSPRERPYEQLTKTMIDIGREDARFVQALDKAHAALTASKEMP